jgi:hypothetical protein
MLSYGNIDEKGADEPNPAYMRHCKRTELRDDKTSSDGLNGSIGLTETDLNAVGATPGDRVKVYVESGDRYVHYERSTYSDRPGIGLHKEEREALRLNQDNREVEIWIDEPDEPEPNSDSETESGQQVSLTGDDAKEPPYVLVPEDSPFRYHHVKSDDSDETECGISFGDREHRRFQNPADALDQCTECFIRSSEDMTNEQLIRWFGEQAGFDHDHGTPTYMSQKQMVALRDYVLELQEKVESLSDDDTDASLARTSALHS